MITTIRHIGNRIPFLLWFLSILILLSSIFLISEFLHIEKILKKERIHLVEYQKNQEKLQLKPYIKFVQQKQRYGLNLTEDEAFRIVRSIKKASEFNKVNYHLALAVAKVESRFDVKAKSVAGAKCLFQVIPRWHKDRIKKASIKTSNNDIYNIDTCAMVGTHYLAELMKTRNKIDSLYYYNGDSTKSGSYPEKVIKVKQNLDKMIKNKTRNSK